MEQNKMRSLLPRAEEVILELFLVQNPEDGAQGLQEEERDEGLLPLVEFQK